MAAASPVADEPRLPRRHANPNPNPNPNPKPDPNPNLTLTLALTLTLTLTLPRRHARDLEQLRPLPLLGGGHADGRTQLPRTPTPHPNPTPGPEPDPNSNSTPDPYSDPNPSPDPDPTADPGQVALNFQTNEMQLRANRGLFAQNGGCDSAGRSGTYARWAAVHPTPPLVDSKAPAAATAAASPAGTRSPHAARPGPGRVTLRVTQHAVMLRLVPPTGGYLLKPHAQKAATKHWLKLEVISAHHVPKVGEGRVQHDAAPWYQHAPALNTKSAAPNARAPDDLYLVATLLGGGADACLLGARPAAASKDEAAVDEAAALGQGQRRLQSKAVSSNGLPNPNSSYSTLTLTPTLTLTR